MFLLFVYSYVAWHSHGAFASKPKELQAKVICPNSSAKRLASRWKRNVGKFDDLEPNS
jgi:hypothetical protein